MNKGRSCFARHALAALVLIVAAFASACAQPPQPLPLSTATATPPAPPVPTATPQPPSNVTPFPTIGPFVSVRSARDSYNTHFAPLIKRLMSEASPSPDGFILPAPAGRQIVLLPANERLFILQSILAPALETAGPDAPFRIYVVYAYQRGDDLYSQDDQSRPANQQLKVNLYLEGEQTGQLWMFGSFTQMTPQTVRSTGDMVQNAVVPIELLGEQAALVKHDLELILGYAAGVDWDPSLGLTSRLDLLQTTLSSPYWADRTQAALSLKNLGPQAKAVVPQLIAALEVEESSIVAAEAIFQALQSIQPEAIPLPVQNSPDSLDNLAGDDRNIPVLTKALSDPAWEKRALAAILLARIGSDAASAVPDLIQALNDPDEHVQAAAATALSWIAPQTSGVTTALLQAAKSQNPIVRTAAIRALRSASAREPGVLETLIYALQDVDENVRLAAVLSLQSLGTDARDAASSLINSLNDPSEAVRKAVPDALFYITLQKYGDDQSAWMEWLFTTPTPELTESP